jgi:hypothetical protein
MFTRLRRRLVCSYTYISLSLINHRGPRIRHLDTTHEEDLRLVSLIQVTLSPKFTVHTHVKTQHHGGQRACVSSGHPPDAAQAQGAIRRARRRACCRSSPPAARPTGSGFGASDGASCCRRDFSSRRGHDDGGAGRVPAATGSAAHTKPHHHKSTHPVHALARVTARACACAGTKQSSSCATGAVVNNGRDTFHSSCSDCRPRRTQRHAACRFAV